GTSNAQSKKTLQKYIDACYYGYDNVGDAQNSAKKCGNKYKQNENKRGVCIAGASLAQHAASKPPPIDRCERDDIDNTKQCKKDYRKCDKEKGKKKKNDCKKEKIEKHIKPKKEKEKKDAPGIGDAGEHTCGTYKDQERNVKTRFDFGCLGTDFAKNGQGKAGISPILDITFAFVRFMSVGVGIVLAASMIMSGIQYSMSEGNAEVTQKAKARIRSASMGFVIYLFAYSILQFLVPGGAFNGFWLNEAIIQSIIRLGL
ncbi:MAG: hypothetical protein WD885_01355, partial [Candidatus Saccharimonadales bacterium]